MSVDMAADVAAALADDAGEDVTWTPAGGSAVALRAVREAFRGGGAWTGDGSDSMVWPGSVSVAEDVVVLVFDAADVAPSGLTAAGAIADGDALTVGGASLVVQGAPVYRDSLRLMVRASTRPA